jgi:hypothetical protein
VTVDRTGWPSRASAILTTNASLRSASPRRGLAAPAVGAALGDLPGQLPEVVAGARPELA